MSAPEGGYQPPEPEDTDPVLSESATEHEPVEKLAEREPAVTWDYIDEDQAKLLKLDFVKWFQEEGRQALLKAGHSLCGRDGNEIAFDAAVKCYDQWPNPRKRELFKESPRYVFTTVRNLLLDGLGTSYKRREKPLGLPGHHSEEDGASASVWDKLAVDDPGWEVRNAMRSLNEAQSEFLFLRFWFRMSQVKAAEEMGITRYKAGLLYQSAIEKLRNLLE
ncbi:sigma-70 family RNA polymerase sigma factor [Dactylosporangium sp. NPDC051541]|uniref:sigma-70 family RNA polymerase sigma factor n=1 Tax=Dactylosporangium sp. NPDC051541 TaxID=3363977 RepID=UPI00378F2E67